MSPIAALVIGIGFFYFLRSLSKEAVPNDQACPACDRMTSDPNGTRECKVCGCRFTPSSGFGLPD